MTGDVVLKVVVPLNLNVLPAPSGLAWHKAPPDILLGHTVVPLHPLDLLHDNVLHADLSHHHPVAAQQPAACRDCAYLALRAALSGYLSMFVAWVVVRLA